MEFTQFMDAIWDKRTYSQVPDSAKKKHFFILTRFIGNKYPTEANNINNVVGVNRDHLPFLCDWWHRFLVQRHVRKPDWFYWKTNLAATDKTVLSKFKKEEITSWMRITQTNSKQLDQLMELCPKELITQIEVHRKSMGYFSRKKPK